MNHYTISCNNHQRHYIDIQARFSTEGKDTIRLQLPAWRPGRYELANYAQNIQRWEAYSSIGEKLKYKKTTKDCWEITTQGASEVVIDYNYYANQLDAGASYYDAHQLYVNPVNCLLYNPEQINAQHTIQLEIPADFEIACGLEFNADRMATSPDYHLLADSPFIASPTLKHKTYVAGGYTFHVWMQGECRPDWPRLIEDFRKFSEVEISMFGELPVKEYHFIYQLPPVKFYHGVEHIGSTVIAMGPGFRLMTREIYTEFLGISSHELFHAWNIKSIRPKEMYPYDYAHENYTNLGYVAEGVTTYYGDLILLRSGVFSYESFAMEIAKFVQRQLHGSGKKYMSLAESSFDTWLDGYKPGVPDRKVSMYVKGMMVAFILDTEIMRHTSNEKNLDNVMYRLYHEFAKQGKGYSEEDYRQLIEETAGTSFEEFFQDYIWGLTPIDEPFARALKYVGLELKTHPALDAHERSFGFKIKEEGTRRLISHIEIDSPADIAQLAVNDEILAINGYYADAGNIDDMMEYFEKGDVELTVFRSRRQIQVRLHLDGKQYLSNYSVIKIGGVDEQVKSSFKSWSHQEYDMLPHEMIYAS